MIQVLYLIDSLPSATGGSEKQLIMTLERLDRSRFDPLLVCLQSTPGLEQASLPCPCEVLNFNKFFSADFFRAGRRLEAICRDRQVDIVHTYLIDSNLFGVFWADRAGVPVTIASRRSIGAKYWYTWRHLTALRYLGGRTSHYIANSQVAADQAADFERLDLERVSVVPNGLDSQAFNPIDPESIRRVREKWGIPPDSIVVGALANLRVIKNLSFLVEAAGRIAPLFPDLMFVILGEGPERTHLEELIRAHGLAGRFFLPGVSLDVPREIQALDIGALVSTSESSPNAVLEYMAAGRPFIASDVGGTGELFVHGEAGYLFPLNDQARFQELLSSLVKDEKERARMGEIARTQVLERHDWLSVMPKLEALYSSLVQQHASNMFFKGKGRSRPNLIPNIGSGLKSTVKGLATTARVHHISRRISSSKTRILMYHGLTAGTGSFDQSKISLPEFDRQMMYLRRHYNVVSLGELQEMVVSGAIEPSTVAVTFDDGYRSVFDLAYPILEREGIPATVYVISGFVSDERKEARYIWTDLATILISSCGQEVIDLRWCELGIHSISSEAEKFAARYKITDKLKAMPSTEKDNILQRLEGEFGHTVDRGRQKHHELLTWEEVRQLSASSLISIGSHTRTHPILSQVDPSLLEDEILGSKREIESHIRKEVHDFAYPNGRAIDITPEVVEITKKGFRSAVTSIHGLNSFGHDPFSLCRIGVVNDTTFNEFKLFVSGFHGYAG